MFWPVSVLESNTISTYTEEYCVNWWSELLLFIFYFINFLCRKNSKKCKKMMVLLVLVVLSFCSAAKIREYQLQRFFFQIKAKTSMKNWQCWKISKQSDQCVVKQTRNLPAASNWKPCKLNDPDHNECMKKSIQGTLPDFLKGKKTLFSFEAFFIGWHRYVSLAYPFFSQFENTYQTSTINCGKTAKPILTFEVVIRRRIIYSLILDSVQFSVRCIVYEV